MAKVTLTAHLPSTRIEASEKEALQHLANAQGKSLSSFIRFELKRVIKQAQFNSGSTEPS